MVTDQTVGIDPTVREVLSGVFDPCCREKGISVVDMGLIKSVPSRRRARPGSSCC